MYLAWDVNSTQVTVATPYRTEWHGNRIVTISRFGYFQIHMDTAPFAAPHWTRSWGCAFFSPHKRILNRGGVGRSSEQRAKIVPSSSSSPSSSGPVGRKSIHPGSLFTYYTLHSTSCTDQTKERLRVNVHHAACRRQLHSGHDQDQGGVLGSCLHTNTLPCKGSKAMGKPLFLYPFHCITIRYRCGCVRFQLPSQLTHS